MLGSSSHRVFENGKELLFYPAPKRHSKRHTPAAAVADRDFNICLELSGLT
jgi:hypothetical protein